MQMPHQRHVPERCVGAIHCHDRRHRHARAEQRLERLGVRRCDNRCARLAVDPGVVSPCRTDQPQRLSRWLRGNPIVLEGPAVTCGWG